jgi:hypothetical protein
LPGVPVAVADVPVVAEPDEQPCSKRTAVIINMYNFLISISDKILFAKKLLIFYHKNIGLVKNKFWYGNYAVLYV